MRDEGSPLQPPSVHANRDTPARKGGTLSTRPYFPGGAGDVAATMRAGGCETRATASVCGATALQIHTYGVGSQSADWGWPSGILGHLIWIMRLIRGTGSPNDKASGLGIGSADSRKGGLPAMTPAKSMRSNGNTTRKGHSLSGCCNVF